MVPEAGYDAETGSLVVDHDQLLALGREAIHGASDHHHALRHIGVIDGDEIEPSLKSLAEAIAAPLLDIELTLRMGGRRIDGYGWLDQDTTVIAVPPADHPDGSAGVFSTLTPLIAHRLAEFVRLGPRPADYEEGMLALKREAFERVAAQSQNADDPQHELELDNDVPTTWIDSLTAEGALHWRVRLWHVPSNGALFDRRCEVLDSRDRGLWLIAPAPDAQGVIAIVTANASAVWRLLSTLLPTADEVATLISDDRQG
jgi:hypothetical protein